MMTKIPNLMMTLNKISMSGGQLPMIMEKLLLLVIPMEYKISKLTKMLKYQLVKKLQQFIKLTVAPLLQIQLFTHILMLMEALPTLLIVQTKTRQSILFKDQTLIQIQLFWLTKLKLYQSQLIFQQTLTLWLLLIKRPMFLIPISLLMMKLFKKLILHQYFKLLAPTIPLLIQAVMY